MTSLSANPARFMLRSNRAAICLGYALTAGLGGLSVSATQDAWAQTIYRSVGPNGQVTYSDVPPASSETLSRGDAPNRAAAGPAQRVLIAELPDLPYALKQVADKFPVVLYASPSCAPCASGRALLTSRGIPFFEKTIGTFEDAQALQRLSGDTGLPMLTVGAQQLKGFSEMEWTQFLDAAGYPKRSALPISFRWPAPSNLVNGPAVDATPQPPARPSVNRTPPPVAPADPKQNNPAGIRF